MKSKLVKAKVIIETEIVVENYYAESPQKCAEDGWNGNRNEIISQAAESGEIKVIDVKELSSLKDLPKNWSPNSLPWLPNIAFGDKKQYKENKISSFIK